MALTTGRRSLGGAREDAAMTEPGVQRGAETNDPDWESICVPGVTVPA
jgi:hypothetical protein